MANKTALLTFDGSKCFRKSMCVKCACFHGVLTLLHHLNDYKRVKSASCDLLYYLKKFNFEGSSKVEFLFLDLKIFFLNLSQSIGDDVVAGEWHKCI